MKRTIFFLFMCLFVSSCQKKEPTSYEHFYGVVMTIPYHVHIPSCQSYIAHKRVQSVIEEVFQEINDHCNHWNPSSEVSLINQGHLDSYPLSPVLYELLSTTFWVYQVSERHYDPTLAILIDKWKQALENGLTLTDEEAVLIPVGLHHFKLTSQTLIKPQQKISLNLDGIAKGFAVDLLNRKLIAMGLKDFLINWGGELYAKGEKSPGVSWKIAMLNPDLPNSSQTKQLHDEAIATSGDTYQKYTLEDGKIYTHIFDPFLKKPLEIKNTSIASVSVVAPSCAIADGLATAAMTFQDKHELLAWIEIVEKKHPKIKFHLTYHQKNNP